MWKNKKFVVPAVILAAVLVATVAGVALAETGSSAVTPAKTLSARVAAILGINQKMLEDAVAKAKGDMANEALDTRLKEAVATGKLTQKQADDYSTWWQSRPQNMPGLGKVGPVGGIPFMGGMRWRPMQPRLTTPAQ
jgi:outer membrane murein-binding lipoprotein Lpp